MEYRYYRELKHNYLVLENNSGDEYEDNAYQYRIAGSKRVRELLPCSVRRINGSKYYYYEINSMQSLKDRFASKGMGAGDILDLLKAVRSLLENMSEFLMTEEGIIFNARCVYTDLSTGEYRFMFCPFFDESRSFSEFALECLELIDESDERAAQIVYNLCEKSAVRGEFIYQIIEEILMESSEDGLEEETSFPAKEVFEEAFLTEDPDTNIEEEDGTKQGSRMKRAGRRLGGKTELLFALMFTAVVGAMVYIRMNYILSDQENLLSILVMLVSAVTGMVALVTGLRDIKNAGGGSSEDAARRKDEITREQEEDMPEVFEEFEETNGYLKKPKESAGRTKRTTSNMSDIKEETYGETVVLGEDFNEQMTLFSRNLDKTIRIALDALPITVGKMEGCVDRVISDASVSRMHCRFMEEDGRVFVLDLGSTNGTYRNGKKLNAQEKTFIEEGDEIRIGRVCFDCR